MKIAIFSDNFYPELSGTADSAMMLGKTLASRGHSVIFVAPRYSKKNYIKAKLAFGEPDYRNGPAPQNGNISTIRIPSVAYPNSPTGQSRIAIPLGLLGSAFWKIKKLGPDLIHVQSPLGVGIEALFVSKLLRIPLIGTNHTPISEFMAYSPFHPKWFGELFVRLYSWYYNRCLFISAPCNALLDDMARHGFKKTDKNGVKKCEAISNPVLLQSFVPIKNATEKTDLKKRFGFSPHTVLYTGRLAEEKHVDVIIRAIKTVSLEIPDIIFALTGHGNAEASLKKLTVELGIQDKVKFLGYVDSDQFPLVYQASDIFAVMSTAETQCLSLMQGFACGLPGIAANAWGLPEYTDPRAGIIVEPGNVAVLAQNIADLFKNPKQMEDMGRAGIESIKKYSPPSVAEKWEETYKKFINK